MHNENIYNQITRTIIVGVGTAVIVILPYVAKPKVTHSYGDTFAKMGVDKSLLEEALSTAISGYINSGTITNGGAAGQLTQCYLSGVSPLSRAR